MDLVSKILGQVDYVCVLCNLISHEPLGHLAHHMTQLLTFKRNHLYLQV